MNPLTPIRRVLAAALLLFAIPSADAAGTTVTVTSPAGSVTQSLPAEGGPFDVSIPLARNAANRVVVQAADESGHTASRELSITQVSLDSVVVSKVTVERLAPEEIDQLVQEGVIDLSNPENYNVSQFTIVITIDNQPVTVSVPVAIPIDNADSGGDAPYPMPGDNAGGNPPPAPQEIIVFLEEIQPALPDTPPVQLPAVLVIDGRIRSLKEFFAVRLLLLNTSGVFTLGDVTASIAFPGGGLTSILPATGTVAFGDILPGDGGTPGQSERSFVVRGDRIGVHDVRVDFGGRLHGAGIDEADAIPFNGSAHASVEVKGPPTFLVQVQHPDRVTANEPYDLRVDITNTGELPALYASLDLDVGGDGSLVHCTADPVTGDPACEEVPGPETRGLGHVLPGAHVSQTFTIRPAASGVVSSCLGVSDQNITLQVVAGAHGCLAGKYPPAGGGPTGAPTVSVLPVANALGVSIHSPVVALFSAKMAATTITAGDRGSLRVFDNASHVVPGRLRFTETLGRTVAIWQPEEAVLRANTEYTVRIADTVTDLDGRALAGALVSTFTTTGDMTDDTLPPSVTLAVRPPVDANDVLPGQVVLVDAYAEDQGSGVARVEVRLKDLDAEGSQYQLIDQRSVYAGDRPPFLFAIDSAQLIPARHYQLLVTAFDAMANAQDATLSLVIDAGTTAPELTLPAEPEQPVLQGISIDVTPVSYGTTVKEVRFFVDGTDAPVKTVTLPPFQASVQTLALALGGHTVRAVAIDGLGRTVEDMLSFTLAENRNLPVVDFGHAVAGAQYIAGQTFTVAAHAVDPVGVQAVEFFLDGASKTKKRAYRTGPIASGTDPFVVDTTGLAPGVHTITILATNRLGITNDPAAPGSVLPFQVFQPVTGPAPAAPVMTSITPPVQGLTTITGTGPLHGRIDVTVVRTGVALTIYADATGQFSATLEAETGDLLTLVAWDYASSSDASTPATVTVPAPPVLVGVALEPPLLGFTENGAWADVRAFAAYDDGSRADVTARTAFTATDPAVASVSSAGRVVAHGNGRATVTAIFDGWTATCDVTVAYVTLVSIGVEPASIRLGAIGATTTIVVTGHYSDGSAATLTDGNGFASADARVVSVNLAGVATANHRGTTAITVSHAGVAPVVIEAVVDTGDNPAPTVAFLGPAPDSGVERGELVPVTVSAQDDVGGVATITLDVTGQTTDHQLKQITPPSTDTTATFVFTVADTAVIGGAIDLAVRATDTAQQGSTIEHRTLRVVDRTPPTATVDQPQPESRVTLGTSFAIVVSAADRVGLTEVGYTTSGGLVRSDHRVIDPAAPSASETFTLDLPPGLPEPDLWIHGYAKDAAGNRGESLPVHVIALEDTEPPDTAATSATGPGGTTGTTVTYEVTKGRDDLDHVELFFRRDGHGTFNRWTDADHGNPQGLFKPATGSNVGTIAFSSEKAGGDGVYEFYTIGVDQAGNREPAPVVAGAVLPDRQVTFAAGTVWAVLSVPTLLGAADTTYDGTNVRVDGTTLTLDGHHVFHNIELVNGARLTHPATDLAHEYGVDVTLWSLTIDATSAITVDALGYLGGARPGNGACEGRTLDNAAGSTYRSAGSYGGLGAAWEGTPNPLYGFVTDAGQLGSGGSCGPYGAAGGNGGGRILVRAINVVLDGRVSAVGGNGTGYQAGSGSGGGVTLEVATLSGTGTVDVSGGAFELGGGGGRIVVDYTDLSTYDTGLLRALGGRGGNATGGNGSVCLKNVNEGNGTLVVDGQGSPTAFTPLAIPPGYVFDNIVLQNQARVLADDPVVVNDAFKVLTGSIVTHSTRNETGLQVTARKVLVDATSSIDVSARGYRGGSRDGNIVCEGETLHGQSGAHYRSGGSYGGYGVNWDAASNPPYGHPAEPAYLGSGGSCGPYGAVGGNGGGRVRIDASEWAKVDGAILADGGTGTGYQAGSGSGGSIRVDTALLRGTGRISAAGGAYEIGGGGGRIAITFDYLGPQGDDLDATRSIAAFGGRGGNASGGAGTVLFRRHDMPSGDLYVDDGVDGATSSYLTPLTHVGFGTVTALTSETLTTDGLVALMPDGLVGIEINPNVAQSKTFRVVSNTANTITLDVSDGTRLIDVAQVGDTYGAVYRFDNLFFRRGGNLVLGDKLYVTGTLRLDEYGRLTHYAASPQFASRLDLTVGTLDVRPTGRIDATALGYPGGGRNGNGACEGLTAPGASDATYRSAGSHGGIGAPWDGRPGSIHGSLVDPDDFGGGGSCGPYGAVGGNGGGRVRIHAQHVLLDGSIRADGGVGTGYQAGSGAGGTINVVTSEIGGVGLLTANGGSYELGGGGGRIALVYDTLTLDPANVQAIGGRGGNASGGNGTVWLKQSAQRLGELVIDGQGFETPDDLSPIPEGVAFDNLTLRNGARVVAEHPVEVAGRLRILAGSRLTHPRRSERGLSIDTDTLEVDATSTIDVSARGYRGGARDGNGTCDGETLGGLPGATYRTAGSHGGQGAVWDGGNNIPYGHPGRADALGAGGSCGPYGALGGNGGGLVRIRAATSVSIDGTITANGQAGGGYQAGSGAGGSIRIEAPLVEGTGTISAAGGAYELGGGGGRIAVLYDRFGAAPRDLGGTRNITAAGGPGGNAWGSAGTVLLRRTGQPFGDLYIDEALADGRAPQPTPLARLGFGNSAALTADTLTLDGRIPVVPNGLVGVEVNPNLNQSRTFTIVSNTANTVTVDVTSGTYLTDVAQPGDPYGATWRFDDVSLRRGAALVLDDLLVVGGTLNVDERGLLTHHATSVGYEPRLDVQCGTLNVSAGSAIDVSGIGYLGGYRSGNGCEGRTLGNAVGATYRSAGSYGGSGGAIEGTPNAPYGNADDPFDLGSGGSCGPQGAPGGNGGGRIRVHATTAVVDGTIAADGDRGNGYWSGSGSGGAIRIEAGSLSGSGSIHANGAGYETGAGGGRVAITATSSTLPAANVSAAGGRGSVASGQDGTVRLPAR